MSKSGKKIQQLEKKLEKTQLKLKEARKYPESKNKISRNLKLRTRCGGCIHMRTKAPELENVCSKLGKVNTSRSCHLYNPDFGIVRRNHPEKILQLADIVKGMNEEFRSVVSYAIMNSLELEKTSEAVHGRKIEFGQEMILNLSVPRVDYVNCWVSANVLGISRDRKSLVFVSRLKTDNKWAMVWLPLHSIDFMHPDEYRTHADKLKKQGKTKAPKKILEYVLPIRTGKTRPALMSEVDSFNIEAKTLQSTGDTKKVKPANMKYIKTKTGNRITIKHD